ncbi:aliphatic sulfonate ABC transporter substrate-binding protein, partial [Pseudomonas sp. MWU13-2625]
RDFAQQHPDVVGAILKQARETGQWVNSHPAETAALIAPKVGLPQPLVETWIKRVPFGAVPLDEKIVAAQQGVADAFYAAKLIPQRLSVADNAWVDKSVQSALAAK